MGDKRYDIVLYGASGFTGVHILKRLIAEPNLTFAVAGRSKKRLEGALEEVGSLTGRDLKSIAVLVANSDDGESLAAMARQARVVINAVGPYRLYGEPVVKAAVENGASYVDISGEPAFLETMQMKYNDVASKNGLYVVGACGWDSIPCDLGVNFLKRHFEGQLNEIETVVQLKTGPSGYSFNAGTYRTLVHGIANMHTDGLGKIRREIMPERLPRSSFRQQKRGSMWYNKMVGGWCLPFHGADKSIVMRSQYYAYTARQELPAQLETFICIRSAIWATLLSLWLVMLFALAKVRIAKDFLLSHPDLCSFGMFKESGPTNEQIEQASFAYWFVGKGWSEKRASLAEYSTKPDSEMITRCVGPDAGYKSTSACAVAAALSLLKDSKNLPAGGVHTTASAFCGTDIYERLENYGVRFEVVSLNA